MPVYVIKTDLSTKKEDCTVENGKKVILDFTGKLGSVKQGDWITASGLNIKVGANETLAFGDTDMVVLPMYKSGDSTHSFYGKVFGTHSTGSSSLIFKIKGYKNKTSSVPSIDDGLNYISFIGDSISTYTNWSNNTSYNSTIGGNAVWYPNTNYTGANLSVENTWWYKTAAALDYKICVNNSWSGSVVTTSTTYNVRAKNIHNTTSNVSPDIVVIFMGINDCAAGTAIGSFDGKGTPPTNPVTFSEAYGRLIKNVQDTYDGIKIYCCTVLPDEKRPGSDNETEYNTAIKTIATNMGAEVIDLYANTGITSSNVSSYTVDKLHPNSTGMQMIADVVVNAIKN
jgi:lysophospholipase L1-like esterase